MDQLYGWAAYHRKEFPTHPPDTHHQPNKNDNDMETALVIVNYPYGTGREKEQTTCNAFLQTVRDKLKDQEGIESLGGHAWLFDLHISLPSFCWLVAAADEAKLGCRVGSFDSAPAWTNTAA